MTQNDAFLLQDELRDLILDSVSDMIAAADQGGLLTLVNRRLCEVSGYTEAELLGRPLTVLTPPELVSEFSERFRLGPLAGHPTKDLAWTLLRKNGERLDVRINGTPIKRGGVVVGVVGWIQDVTERMKVDEEFRRLAEFHDRVLDSTTDLIAVTDLLGYITLVNRRMCETTGYADTELVGKHFSLLMPPSRENVASFETTARLGLEVRDAESFLRHRDGHRIDLRYNLTPLREAAEVVGVVGTAEDVTARKRLEARFLQAQKMESVGRLAGGVAHDFNNLMTAVIGYADLGIATISDADPLRDDLREIRETASRAARLAHQLLALSRREIIEPRLVDLNELVSRTERLLRRSVGEDIELVTNLASDLCLVRIDPGQFEQVLVNLAVNARDAMPDGGALTISTANLTLDAPAAGLEGPAAGAYVVLTVGDTGVGMSDDVQKHLFEPFFTTKDVGRGTGLGLATSYGIVYQAGGTIQVESALGEGTTFQIALPEARGVRPDALPNTVGGQELRAGTETILVVEDEESVRRVTARALAGAGYHVLEAGDGEAALRVASSYDGEIDLVVTDVVMPRVGGKELVERLRDARPNTRILFTSGHSNDPIDIGSSTVGEVAFLRKPFTPGSLALKVREVLDGL